MPRTDVAPLHEWQRHHPQARDIAALITPPMLALSTGLIVSDIRARFGCCERTAMQAVSFARKGA